MTDTSPIFMLAAPRSFTTVVAAMLGQHPDLYGLPELRIFRMPKVGDAYGRLKGRTWPPGLLRTIAELKFGGQTENNVLRASAWLIRNQDMSSVDLFRTIASWKAPLRLVEKSPDNSFSRGSLENLIAQFPDSRFIHMTRHPIPQGKSLLELWATARRLPKMNAEAWADQLNRDPEISWYEINRNIVDRLAEVPDQQVLRIRGEDVMADPAVGVAKLVNWLNISADEAAIDAMLHPERSVYSCIGPPNARAGGDPKFLRDPALRPTTIREHRLDDTLPWKTDGALTADTLKLAEELGYQ